MAEYRSRFAGAAGDADSVPCRRYNNGVRWAIRRIDENLVLLVIRIGFAFRSGLTSIPGRVERDSQKKSTSRARRKPWGFGMLMGRDADPIPQGAL